MSVTDSNTKMTFTCRIAKAERLYKWIEVNSNSSAQAFNMILSAINSVAIILGNIGVA